MTVKINRSASTIEDWGCNFTVMVFWRKTMSRRRTRLPPLPRNWPTSVKSTVLYVISLAQYSLAFTHGWAADSRNGRVRLTAKLDRANQEIALLREEMRIKDARMRHLPPHQRPHYPPIERMAILELKAARNWSLAQAARAFLVTSATISYWLRRLDEEGPDALVQMQQPVNHFPDFITHIVQKLRHLSPMMGKNKIAETLARAGLHLGTTTIGRMLKKKPGRLTSATDPENAGDGSCGHREVQQPFVACRSNGSANRAILVTVVSVLAAAVLAFRVLGRSCYRPLFQKDHGRDRIQKPTHIGSDACFFGTHKAPRHIVCDRGKQFDCDAFRKWCKRKGI